MRSIMAGNMPFAIARPRSATYRALWQIRINAAARAAGMTYSRFMEGLKAAKSGARPEGPGRHRRDGRWRI